MTETQGYQYPGSPPTKASLASWWVKFKGRGAPKREEQLLPDSPGIFGVPLQESIKYARVAISLTDANGNSFIYGYIPIVIAKCGVFLKDKATDVEGIFRLSGSAKRIKDLQTIFNSPEKYGKGLDWTGYTVHDAANILRRYLNQLPEPIIPLDFYYRFREPLSTSQVDELNAIKTYQQLISELPALNRQLLLYILDLLAVFASKSSINLMPSQNLAAIFQPGLISHPDHDMSPGDYLLSQDVLVFLIDNQDHFLLGMRGPSDDAAQLDRMASASAKPSVSKQKPLDRHPSNASAGAESMRKHGGVRRNVSVSSKHSMSGSSPAIGYNSLTRSNTVPSKRSSVANNTFKSPQSPSLSGPSAGTPTQSQMTENMTSSEKPLHGVQESSDNSTIPTYETAEAIKSPTKMETMALPAMNTTTMRNPSPGRAGSQTPTKERNFPFFSKSPTSDSEKRSGNKLRKRSRIPGSANQSAESSTTSLPGTAGPAQVVPSHGSSVIAPPASHPETGQPPLLPITEPVSSPGTTSSFTQPENKGAVSFPDQGPSASSTARPLSEKQAVPSEGIVNTAPGNPASTPSNMLAVNPNTMHSINRANSPAPSSGSSMSSHNSSHSDQAKTERKHRSIWRKSAQKLNLGSGGSVERSIQSPPLTSPPPANILQSQATKTITNGSSSSTKNRNRSKSVDDRAAENKQNSSNIPQRGLSASGMQTGEQNANPTGALSWIQKKLNERTEKRDTRAEIPNRPMSPPDTHVSPPPR